MTAREKGGGEAANAFHGWCVDSHAGRAFVGLIQGMTLAPRSKAALRWAAAIAMDVRRRLTADARSGIQGRLACNLVRDEDPDTAPAQPPNRFRQIGGRIVGLPQSALESR